MNKVKGEVYKNEKSICTECFSEVDFLETSSDALMEIYGIGDEMQTVSGVSQASSRVLTQF